MQLFKCTTVTIVHITETHWINAPELSDAVGAIENRTAIKNGKVGRRLSFNVNHASPIEMGAMDTAHDIEDFQRITTIMTPPDES